MEFQSYLKCSYIHRERSKTTSIVFKSSKERKGSILITVVGQLIELASVIYQS